QSGYDRGEISPPSVRGRYRARDHRGHQQARVDVTPWRRHRRILPPRLQSGQQAGGRVSPPSVHAHAAAMMRSLLFVPANAARKLDKPTASGAEAVIVHLEDSISGQGRADARVSSPAFIGNAGKATRRPRLLVRIKGLAPGLADAHLDAVVPARPDAIM